MQGTGPGPGVARSVAVAFDGDVIAGGFLDQGGTGGDFAVVRLAAADGAERWRVVLPGPSGADYLQSGDEAVAVAVDPDGDVVAAGHTSAPGVYARFTVVKLAGDTGAVLWRHDDPAGVPLPIGIAIDPSGDVYVADTQYDGIGPGHMRLTRRAAATGLPVWTYDEPPGDGVAVAPHPSGDPILLGRSGPLDPDGVADVVVRID